MITDRDREIINYIYAIGFATIEHIADMYFTKQKAKYDLARRRLKSIKDCQTYIRAIKNTETNQILYIPIESTLKRVSMHNIMVVDYVCKLKQLGCDITKIELTPDYNGIIPDALVSFKFNGYIYHQLIEMQLRHDYVDINRFKDNTIMNLILDSTNGVIPTLVIMQNTNKDYSKENETDMIIKQLNLYMDDIAKVLIVDDED